MTRTRIGAALAALALGLALGGCGIPMDGAAHTLSTDAIPADLLAPYGRSTTPTTLQRGTYHFLVYFLSPAGYLVPERRYVSQPPTADDALDFLDLGPTASEGRAGVTTALSQPPHEPALTPIAINARTGVATVTLDHTFDSIFGVQLYEALGQIVYTLTEPGYGIRKVTFLFDGVPENYLPNGTFTLRPVDRADYAALVAPASGRRVGAR
ncbi:MAG TPA: GerMN domain-containing protein [Acidimicrobiales bacterium]|nr:GerMN domain-containing protein [Acidimicrobiales bacterium]